VSQSQPSQIEAALAITRSEFLTKSAGAMVFLAIGDKPFAHLAHHAHRDSPLEHPEPREGITAENVLPVEKLGNKPSERVLESYEAARKYPAILDGILCSCSCGGKRGSHRSLLVCFETPQATGCGECQLEGVFVGKMAKEEKSLAEIRIAFDKEFG
jgi:hypothetical protein